MKIFSPALNTLIALCALMCTVLAPLSASAQTQAEIDHRQKSKNNWRNLGIGSGAVGAYGLLKGNRNLAAVGIAGGLYSAWRYEQDRKSHRHLTDSRARMFSHTSMWKNGHHYVRRTTYKNGKKYYYFARVS